MAKQMSCLIKKKCGTCLWNELKELNQKIYEKKKYLMWLQDQMKNYEMCLDQKNFIELFGYEFRLYDGYSWEKIEGLKLEYKIQNPCIYYKYGCEDLYCLKKDVLSYHTHRLNHILLEYNQFVCLLLDIKNRWQKGEIELDHILLSYEKESIVCMGYIYIKDFEWNNNSLWTQNPIGLEIVYTNQTLNVLTEKVILDFKKANKILCRTYLMPSREDDLLIQIYLEERHIQKGLAVPIINCLNQLMAQLKLFFGKRMKQFIGSYINIDTMDTYDVNQLVELLSPLGYKTVGQMKNDTFKLYQILIQQKK